jgi:hypothetical protein
MRRWPHIAYPVASENDLSVAASDVSTQYRNINLFPFRAAQIRLPLGSTNSRLTNVAVKTLPFRRRGFSPLFAVTTARICKSDRSTGLHNPASVRPDRPTTESHPRVCPEVSELDLAPSILGAHALGKSTVTCCLAGGCF